MVLHPAFLVAVGVLILNDQMLKRFVGGTVPNKLSDIAGLVFFPLVLVALVELLAKRLTAERRVTICAVAVTGAFFAAIKLSPAAAHVYGDLLGWVRWPYQAVVHLARGHPSPRARRVHIVPDRSDLAALVALAVPWWVASRRSPRFAPPARPCT